MTTTVIDHPLELVRVARPACHALNSGIDIAPPGNWLSAAATHTAILAIGIEKDPTGG